MPPDPYLLPPTTLTTVDEYRKFGGGLGLARAVEIGPEQTIRELALSGLRGRGGAGFRTGRKWDTIFRAGGTTKYVVCNAAEGEPGTFKDRTLMRHNPYQIVEGVAIAALVIGAREAFLCLKTSFAREVDTMTRAVAQMEEAGLTGNRDLVMTIVEGPEEYLYGEEKAMLEVIEGKAPLPRLFQPYERGLFETGVQMGWEATPPDPEARLDGLDPPAEANPTLVNNAETMANVPRIMAHGAEWYRTMGTQASPGHVICTVVGDVVRAGVAEIELGLPLEDAIEQIGGGPRPGHRVKAVLSGVSNAVVTSDELDTPLTYERMAKIGSGLGSVGLMVYDESACMVDLAHALSRFLYVESCGQCPACKFGTGEITAYLERLIQLKADDRDVETIGARLQTVADGNRCAIPLEERALVSSFLRCFPEEFADHLEGRRCAGRHDMLVPKIVDIVDGVAVYDEKQRYKQPDWTYAGYPGSG